MLLQLRPLLGHRHGVFAELRSLARHSIRADMVAKRAFDIAVSAIGLIVLAVPVLAIALLVKLTSKGPVFFSQERFGLGLKTFRILKFRTMTVSAGHRPGTVVAAGDPQVTRCGEWMRRYKVDELPQLYNVLVGEMSIVGPRPEVAAFMAHLSEAERREVCSVRPGLTDIASLTYIDQPAMLKSVSDPVAYYIAVVRPNRTALQLEYVRTRSFRGDLVLMARTAGAIVGLARERQPAIASSNISART